MYKYLALGDSYTVGEGVALFDSFPYQLMRLFRQDGISMAAPEIIAKTGWTTGELIEKISAHQFLPPYDLVTLLAGVNNQYRGQDIKLYREEFNFLLLRSLEFAGGDPKRVQVLSIPDWGMSPFASGKDTISITRDIDQYNDLAKTLSDSMDIRFTDITGSFPLSSAREELWASDGLHPSANEYLRWATLLYNIIHEQNIY